MNRMLKLKKYLAIITGMTILFVVCGVSAAEAATLQFKPSSVTANPGDTFDLEVVVDAETKEILAVDALFEYDANVLSIESMADGTYLEIAQKEFSEQGKGYAAGVVQQAGTSVTGKGTLVTVKFKAKAAGSTKVSFICKIGDKTESNISEASIDAPDLIDCSSNGVADVVVGGGSAPTKAPESSSTKPTPGSLPKTGMLDNVLIFSAIGGVLLLIGAGAKLLL